MDEGISMTATNGVTPREKNTGEDLRLSGKTGEKLERDNQESSMKKTVTESDANRRWELKQRLRKLKIEKSIPDPDHKTKSRIISVLIKAAMRDGRITKARKVVYAAHERLAETLASRENTRDAVFLWELAFRRITPGIRPFKTYGKGKGKVNSQACKKKRKWHPKVYVRPLRFKKAVMVAAKWLVEVGREKGRFKPAGEKISDEIIALTTPNWRPRTPKKLNGYYKTFFHVLTEWLRYRRGKKPKPQKKPKSQNQPKSRPRKREEEEFPRLGLDRDHRKTKSVTQRTKTQSTNTRKSKKIHEKITSKYSF
jgi:ribosomal protein S7